MERCINDIFSLLHQIKSEFDKTKSFNIKEISYGLNFHRALAYICNYTARFILF